MDYIAIPCMIVSANETEFLTPIMLKSVRSRGTEIYFTASQKTDINGQMGRFRSTLTTRVQGNEEPWANWDSQYCDRSIL